MINHTLKHIFVYGNPNYTIHFTINGDEYRMDIKSKIHLQLKSDKDLSHLNTFEIIVNKINSFGFGTLEDHLTITGTDEFDKYIMKWYDKADE